MKLFRFAYKDKSSLKYFLYLGMLHYYSQLIGKSYQNSHYHLQMGQGYYTNGFLISYRLRKTRNMCRRSSTLPNFHQLRKKKQRFLLWQNLILLFWGTLVASISKSKYTQKHEKETDLSVHSTSILTYHINYMLPYNCFEPVYSFHSTLYL